MAMQIILSIRYANLLPDRQDEAIILPASQHLNHHLPACVSYPSDISVPAGRFQTTNNII